MMTRLSGRETSYQIVRIVRTRAILGVHSSPPGVVADARSGSEFQIKRNGERNAGERNGGERNGVGAVRGHEMPLLSRPLL